MSRAISLDDLVARARAHKMTPSEKRTQRVSLIMGLRAKRSTLTREKVEEILDDVEGHEASPTARKVG
jgi:hypothetical protein